MGYNSVADIMGLSSFA